MSNFPRTPEAIDEAWLSAALGTKVRGFSTEQIGLGVGILGRIYRVAIDSDGGPATVVAKFPSDDDVTRHQVAAPLRAYEKEVGFYRDLRTVTPVASPAAFATEFDAATGDFALLMSDVGDLRMQDQLAGCGLDDARAVLAAIARHHVAFHDASSRDVPWMMGMNDPMFGAVVAGMTGQSLEPFMAAFSQHIPESLLAFFGGLYENVPKYMAINLEPNVTYAHVDLRLDNVCFRDDGSVLLLDWQLSAETGFAYDVAYFISQSLTTDDRRMHEAELIQGYLDEVAAAGITVDRDAFMVDYRRTVAFCAIYGVIAGGQIELVNDRAVQLVTDMLDRAVQAIVDHDATAVWPAG